MKFLTIMILGASLARGQVADAFHDSVFQACRTRDQLTLVSKGADWETTIPISMVDHDYVMAKVEITERRMRISLRETKKDPELVSKILREIDGKNSDWYLNPTQVIAAMVVVQRDHPESVKEVCGRYEAAIAKLEHQTGGYPEMAIEQFRQLSKETYPCIFYVDGEIMWERMTVLKFLEKRRTQAVPEPPVNY